MIKRIIAFVSRKIYTSSSNQYIKYLKRKGVIVGSGTHICSRTALIDVTRPSLVTIGRDCYINDHFSLLTHDYVSKVFVGNKLDFLPSSGAVTIGNNVSFGRNVTVLKGVTIGDNCFVGAHSVVTRDIPANSIATGIPCKVICTLEEYYNRRKTKCITEALNYAKSIENRFGRKPIPLDFREEFPLFVDGDKIDLYPELKGVIQRLCGNTYDQYVKTHKSIYGNFENFMAAAGIDMSR